MPNNAIDRKELFRFSSFILFDALVFHEVLSAKYPRIQSLRALQAPLISSLEDQWKAILDIDYAPVFELARELLKDLPTAPTTETILDRLRETALSAVASGILLRHDFMGRVYHQLLLKTTGHYYATYYTSIPAARILAHLSVKTPHPEWSFRKDGTYTLSVPEEQLDDFTVIDPACGSGTLLSSVYTALKDVYILSQPPAIDLSTLHGKFMEDVVHGWDVLDYAAHLTLTTLALHEYSTAFDESHIYTVPNGLDQHGTVHLGSLDYLRPLQLTGRDFSTSPEAKGLEGTRATDIPTQQHDLVIMNPPYSRDAKPNVKFGYSSKEVRKRMRRELSQLARELHATGIGWAGLTPFFVLLGEKLVKPHGRLAMVLPRSALSGVSWSSVHSRLTDRFHLEYVVSCFDPGDSSEGVQGWCWSENTDLGEVLIVLRRREEGEEAQETSFANIWRKPRNDTEGLMLAQQILRAHGQWQTSGPQEICELRIRHSCAGVVSPLTHGAEWPNWLFPCLFAQADLCQLTARLVLHPPFETTRLGQLASQLGRDIAGVKAHFRASSAPTKYPLVWGHQGSMQSLLLRESFVGYGSPKKDGSDSFFSDNAGSILIAERPHLHSECLLAARVSKNVLATAFWEVRLDEAAYAPLLLLWLQSTFGFITLLAHSTSSQGDIFKLKKAQLEEIPIVSPSQLDLASVARMFESVKASEFLPFPEEFALAAKGEGVRRKIDDFLIGALGLDRGFFTGYYPLLAADPVVSTRPI